MSRTSIGLGAALVAVIASTASAQRSNLERDVEFVRSLATKLRFIDLAQTEAANLQKTYRDAADFKLVSQLGIEISLIGARAVSDRAERKRLFREALEKSSEFIDRYGNEPAADDARVTMVFACVLYGDFLLEEIEVARAEAPDQIEELEQRAATVLRQGVDACDAYLGRYASDISNASNDVQQKYYYCWLNKGILQRENARAVKRDRKPLAGLARETFEELILEIGEDSLLGLRGYFEMSRIGEVLGDNRGAVSEYQDTIDGIAEVLTSDELDLPPSTREQLFELMQEAYRAATGALLQDGATADALAMCQQFRERLVDPALNQVKEGEDAFDAADPEHGHAVFLTEARAMAESGDPAQMSAALAQVKRINQAHPNDIIGVRAKAVLSDIMTIAGSDPSIVTGSALFEVAKGEYQSRNYEDAIIGLKRAYSGMTDTEKKDLGLEVWGTIGRCHGVQKRYLEAAMAFATALDRHGDSGKGNVESMAETLDSAWQGYLYSTRADEDAAMRRMQSRVNSLLARFGGTGSAAKRLWNDANKALSQKKFLEAEQLYSQIAKDANTYESAQANRVICFRFAKDFAAARKVITEYEAWLLTKEAMIGADDKAGRAASREQAAATIAYQVVSMDYDEANPVNGTKDPTKFPKIIDSIDNFLVKHAKLGQSFFPQCYDMRARLECELGDVAKAENSYRKLKQDFSTSAYVASLATRIFQAHQERVKALETEVASQVAAAESAATRDTMEKLRTARRDALRLGLDYAETAPRPQYGMLASAMFLAQDLRDWSTVERLGSRIEGLFAEDKAYSVRLDKYVLPARCEALVRQERFREAETALRASIEKNPKNYPLKRLLALALGGWVEQDESLNFIEKLGLDKPDEAYSVLFTEYRNYVKAKVTKYSLDWYRFMWESYLFARRARNIDTKYKRYAETLYKKAEGNEKFATLRGLGPDGELLFQMFLNFPPR